MELNVGDKVEIKPFKTLKECCSNIDDDGDLDFGYALFLRKMADFCGITATVSQVYTDNTVKLTSDVKDLSSYDFTEDMLNVIQKKTEEKKTTAKYITFENTGRTLKVDDKAIKIIQALYDNDLLAFSFTIHEDNPMIDLT